MDAHQCVKGAHYPGLPLRYPWGMVDEASISDRPFSRRVIDKTFVGAMDEERYAMLAGNMVEFFTRDGAATASQQGTAVQQRLPR